MLSADVSEFVMYGGCVRGQGEEYHRFSLREQTMNSLESVPTTWDDVLDGHFFRIVSHVLDAHVLEAASCLLAANDDADLSQSA